MNSLSSSSRYLPSLLPLLVLTGIASAQVLLGCSAPTAADTSSESAGDAVRVDPRTSLMGLHETQWVESIGDEGAIPYSALDLHSDGTFSGMTYDQNQGNGVSPLPAYPSVQVAGTWTFVPSNALPSSKQPAGVLKLTETTPRAWSDSRDPNAPVVNQTFEVEVREAKSKSYRLCWEQSYYECVLYTKSATPPSPIVLAPGPALSVVALEAQDNGHTIPVRLGQEINVNLEANRTTGFDWQLTSDPGALGAPVSSYEPGPNNVLGAPGRSNFRFTTAGKTLAAGSTMKLTFGYRRPWESAAPAKTFEVTLSFTN
jgi:predicted secreted protein